jgi:hypothetical protein
MIHPVSARPRVAVVILNFNNVDDTVAAVDAVQSGDYLDAIIVVVDNSPDAETTSTLRAVFDPCVSVVRSEGNVGYAAGNNNGIRAALRLAPVEYIWILNPDTVPAPDALSWLVASADENPSAALVASRLVSADGASVLYDGATIDPVTGATALVGSGEPVLARPAVGFHVTGYAHGASMLVRSESLATTGLIPEDYFLYFEETDLAMRARRAGFTVLVEPRSSVRHIRRSWADLPSSTYLYYMVRNRELFSARWGFDRVKARSVTNDFTSSWRRRVAASRPDLIATFDALVSAATSDGEAGLTGASEHPQALELV